MNSKYQPIDVLTDQEIEKKFEDRCNDIYLPKMHVTPPFGLLNDPNGLAYINGEHHIFFQWHPNGVNHGLKYWYHLSTKDFVNFKDLKIAFSPSKNSDIKGCYSGATYKLNDTEGLISYTGNSLVDNNYDLRGSTQILVKYDFKTNKIIEEIFELVDDEYNAHNRDPQIFEINNNKYFIFGARDKNNVGCLAVYEIDDKYNLTKLPTIYNHNVDCYMWECPDFSIIDNKVVFIFSPQGLKKDNNNYSSLDNVVYTISDDFNGSFVNQSDIFELDKGFDFYAPQTYVDEDGKVLLFGWLGCGQVEVVTKTFAHSLTIPRELEIKDGYIIQKPYSKLKNLEINSETYKSDFKLSSRTFKLQFKIKDNFNIKIGNNKHYFEFKRYKDLFTIDRSTNDLIQESRMPELVNQRTRTFDSLINEQETTIYVDSSTIEIFVNNGINTVTSNFYVEELSDVMFTGIKEIEYANLKEINIYDNKYKIKY